MVMKWAVGEIAPRVDGVPGFVIDVELTKIPWSA